jgi:hypothetical protein
MRDFMHHPSLQEGSSMPPWRLRGAIMIVLLFLASFPLAHAKGVQPVCPDDNALSNFPIAVIHANAPSQKLIVIGFMGGHIHADNLVHKEAQLARDLQERYPARLRTAIFANRDGYVALETVLRFLDEDQSGCLSAREKETARIVIYGHSWGASEAVTLARRLNRINIPVLLTVQVDSVQKARENDRQIPPNVHEAVNFYQAEGMLHGRRAIKAADPARTTILGNFASSHWRTPVSCAGYPWYARAFMRPHIEIENDPSVWGRIEELIAEKAASPGSGLGIITGSGADR